ncbi:MAG: hypothetical protein M1838_001100 [Thelocarpon superellum]|nr:MAG: hypothetical protein M1838_001100 [Thelocarpon superellum]
MSSYLVTPKELSDALATNKHVADSSSPRVIPLCAAWFLPNDNQQRTGASVFRKQHIPTSRFFDLDAVKDHTSPYPHMLPNAADFAQAMGDLGIKKDDKVVVYDSAELGIFSAPRAAWTLRVFGHGQVHVLNNFRLWVEQGYPVEAGEMVSFPRVQYPTPDVDLSGVVAFDVIREVARKAKADGTAQVQILDARPRGRWHGTDPEPRPGLSSGHIPGSLSVPFSDLLDPSTKTLRPVNELKKVFEQAGVDPTKPIISSCGTGVTAAVIDAALNEAGYGSHPLYDGSWTEWAQRVTDDEGLIQKT